MLPEAQAVCKRPPAPLKPSVAHRRGMCYKVRPFSTSEESMARHPCSNLSLLIHMGLFTLLATLVACGSRGDILAGQGAAGIKLGDSRQAAEAAFGKPEDVSSTGVTGAERNEAVYLIYPSKGIDVFLENDKVRTIFLYNEGSEDHQAYPGETPEGLALTARREEVLTTLGEPDGRGLAPHADRWFRYDSGIEFAFREDGSLDHMVVTSSR